MLARVDEDVLAGAARGHAVTEEGWVDVIAYVLAGSAMASLDAGSCDC